MKNILTSLLLILTGQAFASTTLKVGTIYTDQCDNAITFYQLVAQKTGGKIVFNLQCGGYGYSPGGAYLQTLSGTVTVDGYQGDIIPLQTIYTDQCYNAVTFYQLVAQKTSGSIVFDVQCGGNGYSPGGAYLQMLNGYISLH